jgi:hypothetical protein
MNEFVNYIFPDANGLNMLLHPTAPSIDYCKIGFGMASFKREFNSTAK